MNNYQHFVVSGCSFTSGLVKPDTHENLISEWEQQSFAWPHFTYMDMGITVDTNLYNFAIPGGGNIAAMTNLLLFLEKNKGLNKDNTLVGFNITGLLRYDVITDVDDLNATQDPSAHDILNYLNISWINYGNTKNIYNMELLSCISVIQTITYLEHHQFNYFFMLLNDSIFTHAPDFFKTFLSDRKDHWVIFDNYIGMEDFVIDKKLIISNTDTHPNRHGHQLISSYVSKHLNLIN